MAASDQQIVDAARDSLLRILETDTAEWSQDQIRHRQLEIDRLSAVINDFDSKAATSGGRRIFSPITRVNI